MSAQGSSATPRPGGGFNQGFDQFGENMDEANMQQAVTQKMLGQQQAVGVGSPQGVTTGQNPLGPSAQAPKPREVGTLAEELIKRPVMDVAKGLLSIVDFSAALGISPPETKTPEEQARLKATHARFQKLDQEQQALARKKYQEELQKKKMLKEQEEKQKQQRKQQEAQQIAMPSSPKKGPVGPSGSSKQRAVTQLEQDRKTLSGPASAN